MSSPKLMRRICEHNVVQITDWAIALLEALTGIAGATEMALRRVDERTATISLIHAGKMIANAERVISPDGRTMTITFEGSEANPLNTVSIYDKQ